MDFEYDCKSSDLPYAIRVAGALLINVLESNKAFENIFRTLTQFKDLKAHTILQIIYAESVSQSIKSSAGSSYEKRFQKLLTSLGIIFEKNSHDSKQKSIEYDCTLLIDNAKIGVSLKRTLRERYKQNHDDVKNLDVDIMFTVTLGIDLNEDKITYILEKKGHFIFIASDIFDKDDMFRKFKGRLFPIRELRHSLLQKLLSTT